jgi:hypothetical protein
MRFGVREIADVTFRPLQATDIGNQHFEKGQPCLYIDSAQTSTIEGAATTVYAQGGKGNARLIAWEGEKSVTFTVTDALLSDVSFAMLSGAGVVDQTDAAPLYVHKVIDAVVDSTGQKIDLKDLLEDGETLYKSGDYGVYVVEMDTNGAIINYLSEATKEIASVTVDSGSEAITLKSGVCTAGNPVRVDCYVKTSSKVREIEIDTANFAGYYYIEADTLFRDEATGEDFPANFIIPKGKIQSNFTFTMASSGDPSTFDFTIDAFPAYAHNNRKKKVLFTLQVVDTVSSAKHDTSDTSVTDHSNLTSD